MNIMQGFYNQLLNKRVKLHPCSDWWMRGIRYATINKVGRKWIHVTSDAGKKFKLNWREIDEELRYEH